MVGNVIFSSAMTLLSSLLRLSVNSIVPVLPGHDAANT